MDALLAAIVTWLSINFGLPADYDFPEVSFVSADALFEVQHPGLSPEERLIMLEAERRMPGDQGRKVVAAYDTRTQVIMLPEGWLGHSGAELSMLVHEMVHHLQGVAGTSHACPAEREGLAYAAQDRWLEVYGTSLEEEFEIDRMTLLVSTTCGM
jgi:hypothetical protein